MFNKIMTSIIAPSFSKFISIALVIGIIINAFLCYERKLLQAENQTAKTEIALVRSDNQSLANQLERANLSLLQYQQQIKILHEKIVKKLQQAENRSNEILTELEKHKVWRDQPLPNSISRLLNTRSGSFSPDKANSPTLSTKRTMPSSPLPNKK